MPIAKRNNGCMECRRRRVCCDMKLPTCSKCQKAGIECSGQGTEYRFSSYMRKSKSTRAPTSRELSTGKSALSSHDQPRASKPRAYQRGSTDRDSLEVAPHSLSTEKIIAADKMRCSANWGLREAIELVPAQPRMLFNHFSTFIASKMVVLDFAGNGYRNLILPMACHDDLVGEAVSVVAMFHLSQEMPSVRLEAEMRQQRVISQLRQFALMHDDIEALGLSAWITTLVLLVGDTITGSANYTILLQLLSHMAPSLASNKTLPESTRLFISQQTRMFEFFGFPLSSRSKGLETLRQHPEYYLDFMVSIPPLIEESEVYPTIVMIKDATRQACQIYRNRVQNTVTSDGSISSVENLRQILANIEPEAEGRHALVWTCFVAAAESVLPEHREFFYGRLKDLYQCTRFGSIPIALETLKHIWETDSSQHWIDVVTRQRPVLIM